MSRNFDSHWTSFKRRSKWFLFRKLNYDRVLVRTKWDFKLQLNPADKIARAIYLGNYEPEETSLISDRVKPGMIVFDIGANIGYFTLLMAYLVGSRGQVHAFEANPSVVSRLRENIGMNSELSNDRIVVHHVALGAQNADMNFFCPVDGDECMGGLRDTHRVPIGQVIQVPVCTLDEIFHKHDIQKVDFIKMDIEGGELDALKGSEYVLNELRPIILFEAAEINAMAYGYRVFEMLLYLEQRDYTVKQAGMSYNFIAVPR